MAGKNKRWGRILIIAIMMTLVAPLISLGAGVTGRDWYWDCPEPEAHTGDYEKHLKQHIDSGAKMIADKLDKIYNSQSLTSEEKQAKTIEILNKYLLRAKDRMGD